MHAIFKDDIIEFNVISNEHCDSLYCSTFTILAFKFKISHFVNFSKIIYYLCQNFNKIKKFNYQDLKHRRFMTII
jgi:hypothetical protein